MVDGEDLLELETRRRIYDHIRQSPGLHLRQLQRELDMPLGTLEYHLHQMERASLVVTRQDGRFKAFYPHDELDRRDRDILYYLRQPMPRRLAMEIVGEPGVSFQELSQRVPVGLSTLSFHLKKLKAAGLIQEVREGVRKTYMCTDADRVRALVVRYQATFLDDVVDRFAEAWLGLSPR